jgi:CTP-dependent riboflavin kinase
MIVLHGKVVSGFGQFKERMRNFPEVFRRATGNELFKGTINVDVGREVAIREDFRILGPEINEPAQDLLFERCAINDIPAFRIRPYVLGTGEGGHGDHILEISCAREIPNAACGSLVKITLFRDDIDLLDG